MTARRILLVTYFYPPCTDTGAHRPTSMVKYLRRAGHQVTVLTTSAYGSLPDDLEQNVIRTSDAAALAGEAPGRRPRRLHV